MRSFLSLLLLASGCAGQSPKTSGPEPSMRVPAVPADSPHHDLFEGVGLKNACTQDSDCHVGGCSAEICSAEEGAVSPCIVQSDQPRGASCGCVSSSCIWYR